VPYSWLDGFSGLVVASNYEAAATSDPNHDGYPVWMDYVAGTVPTDLTSCFHCGIRWRNGGPIITWSPNLVSNRVYSILGKTNLFDPTWQTPTNASHRFFRVRVGMP